MQTYFRTFLLHFHKLLLPIHKKNLPIPSISISKFHMDGGEWKWVSKIVFVCRHLQKLLIFDITFAMFYCFALPTAPHPSLSHINFSSHSKRKMSSPLTLTSNLICGGGEGYANQLQKYRHTLHKKILPHHYSSQNFV